MSDVGFLLVGSLLCWNRERIEDDGSRSIRTYINPHIFQHAPKNFFLLLAVVVTVVMSLDLNFRQFPNP